MRRKTAWTPYAIAVAAAAVVVFLFWLNEDRLSPVAPGRPAPNFTATDLQGEPRSLKDYRGRVVLVNIWATWCPPCQEEMPSMQRLYETVDDEEFEILAVSIDAPPGEVDSFGRPGKDLDIYAEVNGITFTILHDPSGEIQETFQTTGVPESFVVDRDGVIYKKVAGATAWDAPQNVELIQRLLEE